MKRLFFAVVASVTFAAVCAVAQISSMPAPVQVSAIAYSSTTPIPPALLPKASTTQFGVIEGDGVTTTLTSGVLSIPTATNSALGIVRPDTTTITQASGVLSANMSTTTFTPSETGMTVVGTSNVTWTGYSTKVDGLVTVQINLTIAGTATVAAGTACQVTGFPITSTIAGGGTINLAASNFAQVYGTYMSAAATAAYCGNFGTLTSSNSPTSFIIMYR